MFSLSQQYDWKIWRWSVIKYTSQMLNAKYLFITSYETCQTKNFKRNCFIVSPPPTIPPHFTITYINTLKLTRWLPRHTTRRLYSTTLRAMSEGSVTKVGLAIADKSGLTRWQENPSPYRQRGSPYGALPNRLALRQSLGLATFRPRGMKTTRPTSAARAKELGENKGVADNGLTNTNKHITNNKWWSALTLWRYRRRYGVHLLEISSALPE